MVQTSKKLAKTQIKSALGPKVNDQAQSDVSTVERKRKVSKYQSFRLNKKIPHPAGPIPSSVYILKKSLRMVRANARVLLGIVLIYVILNLVLVRNFVSPLNIVELKGNISDTFGTSLNGLSLASAIFGSLLSSSTESGSETSSLYQSIFFVIFSLAIIWVYRQYSTGQKPTVRGAFYSGLYPLAPFLLVVLTLVAQCFPAIIGNFIYTAVDTDGLAVTGLERGLWLLFYALLVLLTLYMVCSSLLALYVVTLPNMQPMQALRSARQLVFSRRLNVFRKFLVIPTLALLVLLLVVVPAIYFLPVAAPWLYFVLSLSSIVFLHAYLFTLYKELL